MFLEFSDKSFGKRRLISGNGQKYVFFVRTCILPWLDWGIVCKMLIDRFFYVWSCLISPFDPSEQPQSILSIFRQIFSTFS